MEADWDRNTLPLSKTERKKNKNVRKERRYCRCTQLYDIKRR